MSPTNVPLLLFSHTQSLNSESNSAYQASVEVAADYIRGLEPSPDCVPCALEINSVPFKAKHMLTKLGRATGDFIKRRWENSILSNISFSLSHYGLKMIRHKISEATESYTLGLKTS